MPAMTDSLATAAFRQGPQGLGALVLVVVALDDTRRPGLSCL